MVKQISIKFLLASFFIFGFVTAIIAQKQNKVDTAVLGSRKDMIDVLKKILNVKQKENDSSRAKKRLQFSIIPVAGSVAGGGTAVATAFNAAFYTGAEANTSLSTITFTPWFTFNGKFVLPFRNMVWMPNDALVFKGDTRFMVYPQYSWGLGGNTNTDDKVLLEYNYLRFYHSFLIKTGKKIYFGAGYNLDYHFNFILEKDSSTLAKIPVFDYENEVRNSSTSSGPMINFLIDTRHNSINPPGGMYLAADYRFNMEFLGSNTNWQSVLVDARKYFPFDRNRQNLLAVWSYYWGVTQGKPPYLDLPSIGWDYAGRSGRGYEQNRYRGKSLIYFESEYRRDISRDGFWGFVVFSNLHSVSEYQGKDFLYWHPAAGAGLRIKFNKISATNIGLDFAISKDYTGVYLLLGEAF